MKILLIFDPKTIKQEEFDILSANICIFKNKNLDFDVISRIPTHFSTKVHGDIEKFIEENNYELIIGYNCFFNNYDWLNTNVECNVLPYRYCVSLEKEHFKSYIKKIPINLSNKAKSFSIGENAILLKEKNFYSNEIRFLNNLCVVFGNSVSILKNKDVLNRRLKRNEIKVKRFNNEENFELSPSKFGKDNIVPIVNDINIKKFNNCIDFQVTKLHEIKEKFSDYIIVSIMEETLINKLLLDFPNKKIIPCLFYPNHKKTTKFYGFIKDNIERFEHVIFGNAGLELKTEDNDKDKINIIKLIESEHEISNKFIYAPFDSMIENELYQNSHESEFLKHISKKPFIQFCGFTHLYRDAFDLYEKGYFQNYNSLIEQKIGYSVALSMFNLQSQKRGYPFKYISDYIRNKNVWSGLGMDIGVENNHMGKLIKFGFSKFIFYMPNEEQGWNKYKKIFEMI